MKSWLEKKATEMCSTHNEEKSVVAKRFIRSLKNKIYKYMNLISKNEYIDKLDDIVNKCSNIYHITINIMSYHITTGVKSSTYIDSSKETNDKDPKFKIGDIVRISTYKKFFAKGYVPN